MQIVLPTPLYEGNAVTCVETFSVPPVPYTGQPQSEWTPTDPSTITLTYVPGEGPPVVWTYGGTGSIVRVSTGVYSAELNTTAPGPWSVMWTGTGSCAAVDVGGFPVASLPAPFS
jgi:hypothetical protein